MSYELSAAYPRLDEQSCDELSYNVMTQLYGHWRMVDVLGFDEAHAEIIRKSIRLSIDAYVGAEAGKSTVVRVWKI